MCPTACRFDGELCGSVLAFGVAAFGFVTLFLAGLRRREWAMVWVASVGCGITALPLTTPGFRLAQLGYFYRFKGRYEEQVEAARNGDPVAARVGEARVHVDREPFRVCFARSAFLRTAGIAYSPSGEPSEFQGTWHLGGPWYWYVDF